MGSDWDTRGICLPLSAQAHIWGRVRTREHGRAWAFASAEIFLPGAGEAGPVAEAGLDPGG